MMKIVFLTVILTSAISIFAMDDLSELNSRKEILQTEAKKLKKDILDSYNQIKPLVDQFATNRLSREQLIEESKKLHKLRDDASKRIQEINKELLEINKQIEHLSTTTKRNAKNSGSNNKQLKTSN